MAAVNVDWKVVVPTGITALTLLGSVAYWAGTTRERADGATSKQASVPVPVAGPQLSNSANQNLTVLISPSLPTPTPPASPTSSQAPNLGVEFLFPRAGTTVSPEIIVHGKAHGIPSDKHLWLVTRREEGGDFWPKQQVVLNADGTFDKKIWDHGADGPLWICLLVGDDATTRRFNDWQKKGDKIGEWPPIQQDQSTGTFVGCERVTLDNPNSP